MANNPNVAKILDAIRATPGKKALIIVDIQNDFLPNGPMAVPDGDSVIPVIHEILKCKDVFDGGIFASMDWHPADHVSFHSNHADAVPFTLKRIRVRGMDLDQMMWNPHCVQHSQGAELSKDLKLPMGTVLVHKGTDSHVDSYSAFGDDTGGTLEKTELETNLRERGVDRLYVCGLALDYCVHFTAMDAVKAGFQASVILPACRAIAMESADKAILDMRALNVELLE